MTWEITNNSGWLTITDYNTLVRLFEFLLKYADFEVLGFMEHHFHPQGYTAIWLLGESHLAIHTFDEDNKTYWELSSCNAEKQKVFLRELKQYDVN